MNGKVEDQYYNYFSIYSKHSKKNGTLWKFSGTRYTAINLRNIIQFLKKKVNKKNFFLLLQTLRYIILPAQTDHLQISGQ